MARLLPFGRGPIPAAAGLAPPAASLDLEAALEKLHLQVTRLTANPFVGIAPLPRAVPRPRVMSAYIKYRLYSSIKGKEIATNISPTAVNLKFGWGPVFTRLVT